MYDSLTVSCFANTRRLCASSVKWFYNRNSSWRKANLHLKWFTWLPLLFSALCGLVLFVSHCFDAKKKNSKMLFVSLLFDVTSETWPWIKCQHSPAVSRTQKGSCFEIFWFWWFAYSCAVRAHWRQTSVSKTWALLETIKLQKWIRKETHTLQTTHSIKPHKEYLFLAHNLLNSHTYKRAVLTSLDFRAIQWFRKIIWNWRIIEQHRIFFTWNSKNDVRAILPDLYKMN